MYCNVSTATDACMYNPGQRLSQLCGVRTSNSCSTGVLRTLKKQTHRELRTCEESCPCCPDRAPRVLCTGTTKGIVAFCVPLRVAGMTGGTSVSFGTHDMGRKMTVILGNNARSSNTSCSTTAGTLRDLSNSHKRVGSGRGYMYVVQVRSRRAG